MKQLYTLAVVLLTALTECLGQTVWYDPMQTSGETYIHNQGWNEDGGNYHRFPDRETPLTDYHPAFRADPFASDGEDDADDEVEVSGATGVESAVEDTIALLCWYGWEPELARAAVECVCARLAESVSRAGAYESLRRDRHARALLDIPAPSWYRLLRIILGSPDASLTGTNASRGVLLRLLIGESLRHLLADVDLAVAVTVAAPGVMRGRS